MKERSYITILGRSTWALVNTYYSVLRERGYYPDLIHIFTERTYEHMLEPTISALKVISEEFGFSPEIDSTTVSDVDFLEAGKSIYGLVKQLKEDGIKIAIDITPGRRALVAAALIPAMKVKIDHVFYLAITSTADAAKPYMMIPLKIQTIHDFIEESGQVIE